MYEILDELIRKALGITAYRSSNVYINIGAKNNKNPSDDQKPGKSKVFTHACWKMEHSPANSIFVDLRISTNFGVSNGKLGFDFLSPNSAYKMCHLTQGRGWNFNGCDGHKYGKSEAFKDGC